MSIFHLRLVAAVSLAPLIALTDIGPTHAQLAPKEGSGGIGGGAGHADPPLEEESAEVESQKHILKKRAAPRRMRVRRPAPPRAATRSRSPTEMFGSR
jgi:hypothetical protein